MTISKTIAELRAKNGLTQEELAFRVGVSRQAVAKWEAGESTPEISKLIALSDVFETSTDKLLGRESTLYDDIITKLNNLAANSSNSEEIDVLPFIVRFVDYGKTLGLTDEQVINGVFAICGHDGTK